MTNRLHSNQQDEDLQRMWNQASSDIININVGAENWHKGQLLPLARIKKIMKSEELVAAMLLQQNEEAAKEKDSSVKGNDEASSGQNASDGETKAVSSGTAEASTSVETTTFSQAKGVSPRFMIAGEAPILLSKACELLVKDLTLRSWMHTLRSRRRTLQRQDVVSAVGECDIYDFLIDVIPRPNKSCGSTNSLGGTNNLNVGETVNNAVEETPSGSEVVVKHEKGVDGKPQNRQQPHQSNDQISSSMANNHLNKSTSIVNVSGNGVVDSQMLRQYQQSLQNNPFSQHAHQVMNTMQQSIQGNLPGNVSNRNESNISEKANTTPHARYHMPSTNLGDHSTTSLPSNVQQSSGTNDSTNQMNHMRQIQEMIQQQTRLQGETGARFYGSSLNSTQQASTNQNSINNNTPNTALTRVPVPPNPSQTKNMNYSNVNANNYDQYVPGGFAALGTNAVAAPPSIAGQTQNQRNLATNNNYGQLHMNTLQQNFLNAEPSNYWAQTNQSVAELSLKQQQQQDALARSKQNISTQNNDPQRPTLPNNRSANKDV
mmetsp:Transcript_15018/g.19595  ORF Transcript_15018/g.19595 Transcript_15018/m.19595 type:complete len:545 (-) Transcript_15018:202-1836(-)